MKPQPVAWASARATKHLVRSKSNTTQKDSLGAMLATFEEILKLDSMSQVSDPTNSKTVPPTIVTLWHDDIFHQPDNSHFPPSFWNEPTVVPDGTLSGPVRTA